MSSTSNSPLPDCVLFDRFTRLLTAPDRLSKVRARTLQVSHRMLAFAGYLGVSRVFRFIGAVMPGAADVEVREGAFRFRFPGDDYYWNRLLDPGWTYEPELHELMRRVSAHPFTFVDLGANFGYWSARVGAGLYGSRRVVAVEPSSTCFSVLSRNLAPFGSAATAFRYAVAEHSGDEVRLFGTRHAGFSLDPNWPGTAGKAVDIVSTRTLDAIVDEAEIDPSITPLLIKVDVEGLEKQALMGASTVLEGRSIFVIEDAAGRGMASDALQYASRLPNIRLYAMTTSGVRPLADCTEVAKLKEGQSRFQQSGLNILGTTSTWWQQRLQGMTE